MSLVKRIGKVLDEVRKDNLSGSGTLQKKLEEGLLLALQEEQELKRGEEKEIIVMLQDFKKKMVAFAVLQHFVNHLIAYLQKSGNGSREKIIDAILDYKNEWDHVNERIYRNFLKNVLDIKEEDEFVFFLHSQSSTILDFFRLLKKEYPDAVYSVCQTESRPLLEGKQQALALRRMGLSVLYMTDAAIAGPLSDSDMILLGADTIFPGSFINKQGSYPITLMAWESQVPVYVLADSRKFIRSDDQVEELIWENASRPPEEVWGGAVPEGIQVINEYFEDTPAELVTAFVTEKHFFPGDEQGAMDIFYK